MNVNFIIADLISKLNVGSKAHMKTIKVRFSNMSVNILNILYKNGVISGFFIQDNIITINLKYYNTKPVFSSIKVISKPSKRIYYTLGKLNLKLNSYSFSGFYILSTPKGLFTSSECLLLNRTSGEVLLKVEI